MLIPTSEFLLFPCFSPWFSHEIHPWLARPGDESTTGVGSDRAGEALERELGPGSAQPEPAVMAATRTWR